jgi:citronellol/citronellal dehydrogenase
MHAPVGLFRRRRLEALHRADDIAAQLLEGTESELASAAVFLLSEASAFINGTVIRVDGGVPNARHSWPLPEAERTIEYNGLPRYQPPTGLRDQNAPEASA